MPNPDADFTAFVRQGCAESFKRLVERHLPAVHSAACRILTGRTHLADDVAQLVFIRLAKKGSSLPETIVIGAWLHRQTVRLALNAVRGESRRQLREQHAVEMQSIDSSHDSDEPTWAEVMPHIDRAILELPERDRIALALRFIEQRKLREVSQTLGLSTDATQKRITRALEKLRACLSRRGVTPSVAVLGGLLTANSVKAAPPALAGSIIQNTSALLKAGGAQILTPTFTMTIAKSLVAGVATGLIAAGSLAALRSESSPSPSALPPSSATESHGTRTADSDKPTLPKRWSIPQPAPTLDEVFVQVQELLAEPDNEINRLRLRGLLDALPAHEFAPLLKLVQNGLNRWELDRLLPNLARSWANIDPVAALEGLRGATHKGPKRASRLIAASFQTWFENSPDAAQSWLVQNQMEPSFANALMDMIGVVAGGLAEISPEKVFEWAGSMQGDDVRRAALSALWTDFTGDHHEANHAAELPRLLEKFSTLEDEDLSTFATRSLLNDWANWRSEEFEQWLENQEPGPLGYHGALATVRLDTVSRRNGVSYSRRHVSTEKRMANVERALRLAGDRPESEVVSEIVHEMQALPSSMAQWAVPRLIDSDRDAAIMHAAETALSARSWHGIPPPRIALDWVRHHTDAAVREQLIEQHFRTWLSNSHYHGAEKFLESIDWPEELRAVLQRVKEAQ